MCSQCLGKCLLLVSLPTIKVTVIIDTTYVAFTMECTG